MNKVKIYTTPSCPYCVAAKRLLGQKKVSFQEIDVSKGNDFEDLIAKTGMKTVPQIFIGDELIGGYQELSALEAEGQLDQKLFA